MLKVFLFDRYIKRLNIKFKESKGKFYRFDLRKVRYFFNPNGE